MVGDRWSLLIIRDLMFRGLRAYKEFLESDEGIATNILADRLKKLEGCGIISTERDPDDGRKLIYRLTRKGIDLAPVLVELIVWASRHEHASAPQAILHGIKNDRAGFLASIRKKWVEDSARIRSSVGVAGEKE
jgi:DNA-binding HxlR family transcriptional regulator